eukprot:jgi/Astpho2/6250/fgenesh1_pg.00088_%23_59_t
MLSILLLLALASGSSAQYGLAPILAPAPAPAPGTALSNLPAKSLLVSCPVSTTTEVQSLSIKSMQPTGSRTESSMDFTSWLYSGVNDAGGVANCTKASTMLTQGTPVAIPGSSQASVTLNGTNLDISMAGQSSSLAVPAGAQVAACQSNTLYVINVQTAMDILQQIVFNSATSCLGMNAKPLQIASIVNSTVPTDCTDPAYAAQAGIPLPTTYSAPVTEPATSPLNTNPCLGQDAGYSNGLASTFYASLYPAGSTAKDNFPLDFPSTPTIERCDCPDQKTINTTWPGVPVLPDDLVSNYGVEMTGEFLVQRPQDGVTGETAAIFPTASDYHLVCLQHDGSAGMVIDSISYYSSTNASTPTAGFVQYCVPISMAPGWHNLTLTYGNTPVTSGSVFRFFVINAANITTVSNNGTSSYEIDWVGQGKCCTSGSDITCQSPLSCCNFRNQAGTCPAANATVAPVTTAVPATPATTSAVPTITAGPTAAAVATTAVPASTAATTAAPAATTAAPAVTTSPPTTPTLTTAVPTTAAATTTAAPTTTTAAATPLTAAPVVTTTGQPETPVQTETPAPTPPPATTVPINHTPLNQANEISEELPLLTFLTVSEPEEESSGAPSPGDSSSILPLGVADSPAYNGPAVTRPPTPAFAPAGTQLAQCGTIPSTCVSANTADAPLVVNLNLTCNPNQTITTGYTTQVVYTVGTSGWLAVSPSSGTITINQPTNLHLTINPSAAGSGYHTAYVVLMQTIAGASTEYMMGSAQINFVNIGPVTSNLTSISVNSNGTANVTAQVAVDFVAPQGTQVPMTGQLSTNATTAPVSCSAAAPSSVQGNTSLYSCASTVSLQDPYTCLQTPISLAASFRVLLPSSNASAPPAQCGAFSTAYSENYCTQPVCQLFAVDMAFCGSEGLVTDSSSALLVMVCTQPVQVCNDCFTISGPQNASVEYFNQAPSTASSYQLFINWDPAYQGPITVGLADSSPVCNLGLLSAPGCGSYSTAAPVPPLSFTVRPNVQIKSVSYKILAGTECGGGQCSYSL